MPNNKEEAEELARKARAVIDAQRNGPLNDLGTKVVRAGLLPFVIDWPSVVFSMYQGIRSLAGFVVPGFGAPPGAYLCGEARTHLSLRKQIS